MFFRKSSDLNVLFEVMYFLFSSVRPNAVQTPECASHIGQAYAEIGPIRVFNPPRGTCVDESDLDPTFWIPR